MRTPYRDPRTLVSWSDLPSYAALVRKATLNEFAPSLRTRLAWDIVPDDDIARWSEALGLNPESEDVSDHEQAQSIIRRAKVTPIADILGRMATVSGELISAARIEERRERSGDASASSVGIDDTGDIATAVIAGSLAVVIELLDLGILTYGKALRP